MHLNHLIRKHEKVFIDDIMNELTLEVWQEISNQYQATKFQLQVLPISLIHIINKI